MVRFPAGGNLRSPEIGTNVVSHFLYTNSSLWKAFLFDNVFLIFSERRTYSIGGHHRISHRHLWSSSTFFCGSWTSLERQYGLDCGLSVSWCWNKKTPKLLLKVAPKRSKQKFIFKNDVVQNSRKSRIIFGLLLIDNFDTKNFQKSPNLVTLIVV